RERGGAPNWLASSFFLALLSSFRFHISDFLPMTSLQHVLDLGYEVKLPVFEGPLDLLLYLVEKNELNTKDISIAAITDQYLEHLSALDKADLGEAGEFLVMASRLMRLKARELLPA